MTVNTCIFQVSTLKCGFLPMSQESLICGEVSYHEYNGILVDQEERDSLQRHLGPNNKVSQSENHNAGICDEFLTIEYV